jgi:hypothetical protein
MTYEEKKEETWALSGKLARAAAGVLNSSIYTLSHNLNELEQVLLLYNNSIMDLASMKDAAENG